MHISTASFHITKSCNFKCRFCYATFKDIPTKTMSLSEGQTIILKLYQHGLQKITFAGGEPLLHPNLKELIIYAKSIGLTTSIITNGELLTYDWLKELRPHLDWVGVSIDSLNNKTNREIGRNSNRNYIELLSMIKELGYKLKINTVVNKFNKHENFNDLISLIKPDRWKVFQVLKVNGQNNQQFDKLSINTAEFNNFLDVHSYNKSIVPESNDLMTGSYLLIDYLGRLFENSLGHHTYSKSILQHNLSDCYNQIVVSKEKFIKRGGIYNW